MYMYIYIYIPGYNWGLIISREAFFKVDFHDQWKHFETVQDKVTLPWILLENSVLSAWVLLEYSLNFMSKKQHRLLYCSGQLFPSHSLKNLKFLHLCLSYTCCEKWYIIRYLCIITKMTLIILLLASVLRANLRHCNNYNTWFSEWFQNENNVVFCLFFSLFRQTLLLSRIHKANKLKR